MFGTRTKLDRAIAVVVALHREAADAVAVFAAFEVVTSNAAMMPMTH
jgi:hypothetical protein